MRKGVGIYGYMPREVLESTTQCHGSIFYIYNNTHKKAKQSVASGLSCHLSEIYGGEEPLESSRGIQGRFK